VNTFLRIAKGNGIIRSMKRAISATRSRKTWEYGQLEFGCQGWLLAAAGSQPLGRPRGRVHTKV